MPQDIVLEQIAVSQVAGDGRFLMGAEHGAVSRAVLKRRREFEAGRLLARRALRQLGMQPCPLPPGPGRAPLWPPGVVGSITHTRRWCVAALGRRNAHRAVGIDLEPREPIKPELFRMICNPPELAALDELPPAERGVACRVIFSAKEAAYKAQFMVSRTFLPFSAMSVSLEDGAFEAVLNVEVAGHFAAGHAFAGRYRVGEASIETAVVLPS